MASLRKLKNKSFLVEIRKHGQYYSKTFPNKVQAMAWAAEKEQGITKEGIVKGKTLGDAFTRYRDEISPSKKSHKNEHNRLNRLLRHPMAKLILIETDAFHFDEFVEERLGCNKSSSVNRDLNALSAVFEQAIRWRWTTINPIRKVKRPKNPQSRERRISDTEIERILDALGFDGETVTTQRDIIAVSFLFALETAMRQGEIFNLTWENVFLDKKFVRLHETKNGTRRDVPLSSEAIRLLNLLHSTTNSKVFNGNQGSCATIFRRSVKLAGIENIHFHDTRHEGITRLAQKISILDLAKIVGHRDIRSLMHYYDASAEEIAERLG